MKELSYRLRLRIYGDDLAFGPGVARLMQEVEETGSLSEACRRMGMAYSKGWKILKRAQDQLGFELVEGNRGGVKGGGMHLTSQGKEFLGRFLRLEEEVNRAAAELFPKYMAEKR